jgi:hypothetical protein
MMTKFAVSQVLCCSITWLTNGTFLKTAIVIFPLARHAQELLPFLLTCLVARRTPSSSLHELVILKHDSHSSLLSLEVDMFSCAFFTIYILTSSLRFSSSFLDGLVAVVQLLPQNLNKLVAPLQYSQFVRIRQSYSRGSR